MSGDSSSGAEYLGLIAMMEGDRERACRHTAELIDEAPPGSDGVMASWKSMLARDLYYLGRIDEVEPLLDAARMAGWHPVERTLVSAVEALLLSRAGAHDQAEERARAAVATAETETDNVWLQGWSNEDLALVLERAGRVDEAREALKRALAVWERKRCLPYVRRVREQSTRSGRRKSDLAQETFPHTGAGERALLRTSDRITRRSQVQILPPLLEKPRKRGFSVLWIVIGEANFCQLLRWTEAMCSP